MPLDSYKLPSQLARFVKEEISAKLISSIERCSDMKRRTINLAFPNPRCFCLFCFISTYQIQLIDHSLLCTYNIRLNGTDIDYTILLLNR